MGKIIPILSILIHLIPAQSFCQKISGIVVDSLSGEKIPHAHVAIRNTNYGTITNINGEFKMILNPQDANQELIITHIGYETKVVTLTQLNHDSLIIQLIGSKTLLNEVTILPEKPIEILTKAFRNLPNNYSSSDIILRGFYRELTKSLSNDSLLYIAEGILDVFKQNYSKNIKYGLVIPLRSRSRIFPEIKDFNTRFYAGPHTPHRFDFVMRKERFINPDYFKNYNYNISNIFEKRDAIIFEITFVPKPGVKELYQGKIYVKKDDYAYMGAEYSLTSFGVAKENSDLNFGFDYYNRQYKVMYDEHDSLYYLNYILQQGLGNNKDRGDTISYSAIFSTTKIITDSIYKPETDKLLGFREVFLNTANSSDTSFWEDYTVIRQDKNYNELFNRKNYNDKRPDKLAKIVAWLNVDYAFAINKISLNNPVQIDYKNGSFNSIFKQSEGKHFPLTFNCTITYEINPTIEVGWQYFESLGKSHLHYNGLIGRYNWTNLVNYKTLVISPSISVGHTSVGVFLNEVENDTKFEINGKEIDASKINVNLVKKGWAIIPGTVLSYGFKKAARFFIGANLHYYLHAHDGLRLKETTGFYLTRKSAFEESSSDKVSLSAVPDLKLNYSFSLGFRLGL